MLGLKASTNFNDGKFPSGLTVQDLGNAMYETLADKSQIENKMRGKRGNLLLVARAWAFISDPANGSDWHWGGAGVAMGAKDTPILWFKPAGKQTYTVFDADLTVHADQPEPTVASKRITIPAATQAGK